MDIVTLDGSYGEGGGQILRTALSLSTITARPFRLANIRAGRRNPGLLPQHLAAVYAAAAISRAILSGDRLGSSELSFAPSLLPSAGSYVFDVAQAAERGSAGSATLVLQTLIMPLALAEAASKVVVRGGTHVEWSPPFDHFANAYLPALGKVGFRVDAELKRWGWYPVGGGEIVCTIAGRSPRDDQEGAWPRPVQACKRGALQRISGRSVAANLPAHIPQRMADRARASLEDLGVAVDIQPQRVTAACPGAGIFLLADYEPLLFRLWPAGAAVRKRCRPSGWRAARASRIGSRRRTPPRRPAALAAFGRCRPLRIHGCTSDRTPHDQRLDHRPVWRRRHFDRATNALPRARGAVRSASKLTHVQSGRSRRWRARSSRVQREIPARSSIVSIAITASGSENDSLPGVPACCSASRSASSRKRSTSGVRNSCLGPRRWKRT